LHLYRFRGTPLVSPPWYRPHVVARNMKGGHPQLSLDVFSAIPEV
jgi:hypothetical protein